jgi:transposase
MNLALQFRLIEIGATAETLESFDCWLSEELLRRGHTLLFFNDRIQFIHPIHTASLFEKYGSSENLLPAP